MEWIYPEFEVIRDRDRCIACRVCERQCANEVHRYDPDRKKDAGGREQVRQLPPVRVPVPHPGAEDRQDRPHLPGERQLVRPGHRGGLPPGGSGGVLLSSMGNPKEYPVYWDKLLLNASQVTNPPIDPLREPMETKTFLGRKPTQIERDEKGSIVPSLPPQLELSTPILFSAMSYGSISYNAHASLARAARQLGIYYNTGEGGLHQDFYQYGANTIVQVASGRFGVHKDYLNAGAAIEIKMGQGAKPGIGGHLPGAKIVGDVSRTRMIPEGTDAISPAPHHDIYSIEDLRQLVFSLKEATHYEKPVIVKIAAVHNVAAIASGIARSGADIIAIDGFRGGTGAAPTRIRDNVGIPIELALAAVDQRLREEGIRETSPWWWAGSIRSSADAAQGHHAGGGRGVHRHGGPAGPGLPPVPQLPRRQVQLGHRHPAARPGQAPESRSGHRAPGEPGHCLDPRDEGDDGRHGHQLHRGPAGQPADAAGRGPHGRGAARSWASSTPGNKEGRHETRLCRGRVVPGVPSVRIQLRLCQSGLDDMVKALKDKDIRPRIQIEDGERYATLPCPAATARTPCA